MNVELHHLRHYVAVVEEQHFGRAALRLGMAQPPLSQSIKRLEAAVGVRLLERVGRRFAVTQAGRVFFDEAVKILAHADLAVHLARRVASGRVIRLRIGCMPWSLLPVLPQAIRRFRAQSPDVEIQVFERSTRAQADGLRDGSLDLGIVAPDAADMRGFEVLRIEHSTAMAAVPAGWEIGSRKSLRFAELARFPFIMFPRRWNEEFLARFHALCQKSGFVPNITQEAGQPYTMLAMVASELGVTIVQSTARYLRVEGVAFIPIEDMPKVFNFDIAIAWEPANASDALRDFVGVFQQAAIAAEHDPPERYQDARA
jgi:DNA-binding transcriptional LysR family regulator